MQGFQIILFDLDGTLVDSKSVIVDAANNMLEEFGFARLSEQQIIKHIRFDTTYLVEMLTGFTEHSKNKKAVDIFRDYWKAHVSTDSKLFEGVVETLKYLSDRHLIIASNGIKVVIEQMLDYFNIRKFFSSIISGDEPDCIKPTACPINRVLFDDDISKRKNTIIVGDMVADIAAGKAAGIKTCAVTYGLGNMQDLKEAKPDYIIDNIIELKKIIKDYKY